MIHVIQWVHLPVAGCPQSAEVLEGEPADAARLDVAQVDVVAGDVAKLISLVQRWQGVESGCNRR